VRTFSRPRPGKTFFRQSLDDFTKIVAPSGEARQKLAELENLTKKALAQRDEADKLTRRWVLRIVNAVKGDPDEGEDSELLARMGYLPHTARTSIIGLARRNARKAAEMLRGSEEGQEE